MNRLSGCYASLRRNQLIIGNLHLERTWSLAGGVPQAVSLRDCKRHREWLAAGRAQNGFQHSACLLRGTPRVSLATSPDDGAGLSEPHIRVIVILRYPGVRVEWEHRLWPDLPIMMSSWTIQPIRASGRDRTILPADRRDQLDFLALAPFHLQFKAVAFYDVTDTHNNLVEERVGLVYPGERHELRGNILHLADVCRPGGLLALKLSPSPVGHLAYPGGDFVMRDGNLAIVGTGVTSADLRDRAGVSTYGSAVGVTDGASAAAAALVKAFMRKRWRPNPARDFSVLANTWGDRNSTNKICGSFIQKEITAAAKLGLTHCQLDDGWQAGDLKAVYKADQRKQNAFELMPDFWTIAARKFPRGFEPIAAWARQQGVRLGLWFLPDFHRDYAGWQKDAATVLRYWKTSGFDNIKFDGVRIASKRGEANFMRLMRAVRAGSRDRICINLDVTAGRRPGYFFASELAGNLFLENRYTDWRNYYPHWTLRNLWQLSRYLPTYKFQVEFLNTERNRRLYAGDPLAPQAFGLDYAFAVTMMANPLCWMEVSRLSPAGTRRLGRLIRAYRAHQAAMLLGNVYPIGEEPSGRAWTGFQSVTAPGQGYLLVFREWNNRPQARMALQGLRPGQKLTMNPVAGRAVRRRVSVARDGAIPVSLPRARSFALWRYATTRR